MTAKHPPHKLLYPEKSDPLFFKQNPEHLAPARPLADVPDSDRPPRSDGAAELHGASPASDAHAPPPEVAYPVDNAKAIALGKTIAEEATAQWSEPMPHAAEDNEQNAHQGEQSGVLALIERLALVPNINTVEVVERLLAAEERVKTHNAETAFLEAKARVKRALVNVKFVKTKLVLYDIDKNDKKKGQAEAFRYCPLEDIDKILAPLLAENDLDLTYTTRPRTGDGGGAVIVGKLRHIKGHQEESEMPLPLDTTGGKSNIQAMGSTNHYGRRYVASNIFNIVVIGDDDDGTGGTIDEAQAKTIRDLLKRAHAADPVWSKKTATEHEAAFLRKIVHAPSVEEIPFRMYRKAVSELEDRIPNAGPS